MVDDFNRSVDIIEEINKKLEYLVRESAEIERDRKRERERKWEKERGREKGIEDSKISRLSALWYNIKWSNAVQLDSELHRLEKILESKMAENFQLWRKL